MDYQSMKRRELQALCKKHGVQANLSNREMADRLSSILGSRKSNNFYEISGYKRGGRRRGTLKLVPKKQIQPTENDVFSPSPVGRKRARLDVKKQGLEVRSADECNVVELGDGNVIGGLIRRQLRNREVVVGQSDGDSVISRNKVTQRGSKVVRNKGLEENVIARKDSKLEKILKAVATTTWSSAQFESGDSENEEVEGDCEKPQLEEPSKQAGRNALMRRTVKANKDLLKRKQDVTNNECCKMTNAVDSNVVELADRNVIGGLIKRQLRNREVVVGKSDGDLMISRKKVTWRDSEMTRNEVLEENIIANKDVKLEKISKTVGRITVSQAQFESEKYEGQCEKVSQPEKLLRGVGRNALMRKRKQDVMNDECSKILNENSRKVESVNWSTRSRAKAVVAAGAAESKNEEEIVHPEEPSKGLGKYNLRKKSVVPNKGKVGNNEVKVKKENRKRSKDANLEGISELEAILYESDEFEMVENIFVPSGPSRRTRRNSVIFVSTDTTNEGLESSQNIGQKDSYVTKNTPRGKRQNVSGTAFAESHLAATEMGRESTTKIQLSKGSGGVTEASMRKLTSKSEGAEVKMAANQIVVQSTMLERSNANFVEQEELSGKGSQNYDEIIFKCETSISNAGNEICNQAKTDVNVTINNIEPEEALYNERASQVVGEMIINEDHERNLFGVPSSEKTDGKDAKNKETEVLEGCAQDAMSRENEFSEQNPNNVSKETRGRCLHELSDAKGINMIIIKETGTDSAHGTVNKGSFPYELDSLKNHTDHEKEGSLVLLPIDFRKSLSIRKDKLQSDTQDTFKAEVNENVGGLKVAVQEQSLLQLAMEDLRDGIETATPDATSNSSKVLCQLRGNCNSVNWRKEQVCDDIYSKEFPWDVSNAVTSSGLVSEKIYEDVDLDEKKNSSVNIIAKDEPFNEDYAANKGIDDKGSNGESGVQQCADVTQEENPNCTLKVELREQSDNKVAAPQENTSLTELISIESEVSNEIEVETTLRSAECTEQVDNLTVKESKSENRSSHTVGNDVGALAQATSNHLLEEESMETRHGSVQNIRIAAGNEAHAVSIEKRESLWETENVETSIPVSPEIPRKTYRDEFAEIFDSAPGVSNEVLHPNIEDLDQRSNDVVGFVPPADEYQVCVDIYSKEFSPDESNAIRSSEIILERIYDDADLVGETNSSVDIIKDVPFNEDYAASKGIDGKGFYGQSDVDQCANVAKEENPNCALNVELQDKSDNEPVVHQENGTTGTSLTDLNFREREISNGKEVEAMLKSAECIERLDNLMVKVCKSENRNSHIIDEDVGALAQATSNHLVEEKDKETHDGSVQNIKIAANEEVHTVSIEKRESLREAENVETFVPGSPEIPRKTSRDEFAEICDSVPAVSNEVLHGNGEDLEERSNDVVGFLPPTDGGRFGDLNNYKKQNVLQLERSTPVISDDLMPMSGKAAYRKENAGIIASDLHSNSNCSDAEKEDNEYTISQVTKEDKDDHLPEVKLCNANDSDHSVLLSYASSNTGIAADASEVAVDGTVDSENIEAGTNWLEKTPTLSQTSQSKRKQGEKNSSEGRYFLDTSFAKPEMGSANDAVDMDSPFKIDNQIIEKTTLTDQKDNEGLNDSIHDLNIKDNARTSNEQHDQKDAVIDTGFTDSIVCSTSNKCLCSERRKSITEVAEEGACSDKVCNMVVNESIEVLPAVSSSTPRMSADFSAFSPKSKSSEFHFDFPHLTNLAMNKILGRRDHVDVDKSAGGIFEGDLTAKDYNDAMPVKENLRTNDLVDQQTTEKHLGTQEHHTYRTVLDEPICDNEEPKVSAISREDLIYEIQKDKSNAALEKVMLKEETTTKGSNIADLDELKAGYVSDDLKEADHIAVDPGVFSCSGSRVNSIDVHTEATEKMNMQEVKNVDTILPVTPQEPCADCEKTRAVSHEISGTILQQIFRSGSGWKEKICDEMAKRDVHSKDYSNDAGRIEMADKDEGNNCRDMSLLFQDNEAMIGSNEAVDSFSVEHNVYDSQEVTDQQIVEHEAIANEATFKDDIHCLDDKIVAATDFKKVADFENSIAASTLTADMAVDYSAVSAVVATSNHENKIAELNVESNKFTSPEMNLYPGSRGQDETKNSDAKDVNVMIMEQVAAKFPEEQLSEQKKADEVSELNSALHSDLDEHTTEQNIMLTIIHGILDNKKLKNEPLKFESTNLAAETAADNAWTLELKLLSPQQISPESKTRGNCNSLFAKKLNSSTRKQNNKSILIQRTPKQLGHDRKEKFPSTKKQKTRNFTAHNSLLKRRALEDLRK